MSTTVDQPKIPFSNGITRFAMRQWIQAHAGELENAQAAGTLARTKLDLKDTVESELPYCPPDEKLKYEKIFQEELEAFCADMRLASVTVQAQVERKKGFPVGRLMGAIGLSIASTIILLMLIGNAGAGGGAPGFAGVILLGGPPFLTFFFFQMMTPQKPEEKQVGPAKSN